MKILVLGHLGTLGKPLMQTLKNMKHDVYGADIRHSEEGIRCDIANWSQVQRLPDVDLVYHLAAEFGRHNGEDYNEQLWNTNAIGTKNILKLQTERGFKMVFASSSEVYGDQHKEFLTEKNVASHPSMLNNDYAVSKWVNESQIEMARKKHGNETMVLRFFNAYGPGEYYHAYRSVVCLFCYRALKGLPYTVYKDYHRVFQYTGDLVDTLARCTTKFFPGFTMNVGGIEYRSVEEMHNIVSDVVGVPRMRNEVEFADKDMFNITNKRPDISLAQTFLHHNPSIPLEEGIQKTVQWMRHVYKVSA